MITYDIGLFDLDNYQWTEDLYDFYDSIGWIQPEQIIGYSKDLEKTRNLQTSQCPYVPLEDNNASDLIADYYLYCFQSQPDIEKFIDSSIWLMTELADSTSDYIFPIYIREYFENHDGNELDKYFEKIYQHTEHDTKNLPKEILHLLIEFIFETFQYGSEWCVYLEPQGKPSMCFHSMTVQETNDHNYLCAKLLDNNLAKLASLENYS